MLSPTITDRTAAYCADRRSSEASREDPVTIQQTGECWCGCGESTGSLFAPGHDKFAESALIKLEYGSVAQFLADHGYGPGGRNLRSEIERSKPSS